MNFDEVIEQQREKQNQITTASAEFITTRQLFEALMARYPDQSLETFSEQLFRIFQKNNPFPAIYHRDSESAEWAKLPFISLQNQHIDKSDLYALTLAATNGRYHSISGILDSVKKAPLEDAGLELYGLRRSDVTELLGFAIETTPAPTMSDYVVSLEQQNAVLGAEIQRMKECYQPPALSGESYAANREEIFIAVWALLHDLDRKGKLKPGSNGLCIPNAAKLEVLLHQNQKLFWPLAEVPPVSNANIKGILREPAGFLREGGDPNLELRRQAKREKNRKLKK